MNGNASDLLQKFITGDKEQRVTAPAEGAVTDAGSSGTNAMAKGDVIQHASTEIVVLPDKKAGRRMAVKVGQLRVAGDAEAEDLINVGGLLPGADQYHIGLYRGRLGYDPKYMNPEDPFRWNKLRDLIDSGEKILIERKMFGDKLPYLHITPKGRESTFDYLKYLGITFTTEGKDRNAYPRLMKEDRKVSREKDVHHIYYPKLGAGPGGSLSHELFGHLWLAFQGVPYLHPEESEDDIKERGTLGKEHNIRDPLGNIYSGKVGDFIRNYVSSQSFLGMPSLTWYVSREFLLSEVETFTKKFRQWAKGKMKSGASQTPGELVTSWTRISNNYVIASKDIASEPDPIQPQSKADAGTTSQGTNAKRPSRGPVMQMIAAVEEAERQAADTGTRAKEARGVQTLSELNMITRSDIERYFVKWDADLNQEEQYVFREFLRVIVEGGRLESKFAARLRQELKPLKDTGSE